MAWGAGESGAVRAVVGGSGGPDREIGRRVDAHRGGGIEGRIGLM